MRRIFTTAIASSVLVLAVSGVAVAAATHHDGRHDHHAHHANRHRRSIQHAHAVKFGAPVVPIAASGASAPPASAPSPTSSAATIVSFTNGTLTIRLVDGSMVSGRVSEETEIACQPIGPQQSDSSGGPGPGDDQARDDNDGRDDNDEKQDNEEARNDDNDNERRCTAAALLAGVVVREAELRVSGAGAVWEELEMLR
jgi:hypothetical protein